LSPVDERTRKISRQPRLKIVAGSQDEGSIPTPRSRNRHLIHNWYLLECSRGWFISEGSAEDRTASGF